MARHSNSMAARTNAQANANQTGVRWVVFLDTSGAWNSERYNPGVCACHNDPTAVLVTPDERHHRAVKTYTRPE